MSKKRKPKWNPDKPHENWWLEPGYVPVRDISFKKFTKKSSAKQADRERNSENTDLSWNAKWDWFDEEMRLQWEEDKADYHEDDEQQGDIQPRNVKQTLEQFVTVKTQYQRQLYETGTVDREITEALWRSVADALAAYQSRENGWPAGPPVDPFSPELAGIIELSLRGLLAGRLPVVWEKLVRQGAPSTGASEQADKEAAVRYIHLATGKNKIINDPTPVKTVREKYGIKPRTIQYWQKQIKIDAKNWFPHIDKHQRAELATSRMQKGGDRYSQLSGSHKAIQERGRKPKG